MALSRIVATGNGVTTTFVVSFALGYIKEEDVTCRVGSEADGGGNPIYRSINWLTPTQAQISGAAPGNGVKVVFERSVPRDVLLVDWEDDAVLTAENLDLAQKQALMLVHEVLDGRFATLSTNISMGNFQINDLANPTVSTDAANKFYVDSVLGSNQGYATAAAASAAAAESARSAAVAAQGVAVPAAAAAALSETNAGTHASTANTRAGEALTHRNNAQKWASEAVDVPVNDGTNSGFSAYHWSVKAAAAMTGVTSVAGRTGVVTVAHLLSDLNLPANTNTSLAAKADAAATTTALAGKAATSHTHSDATTGASGFMSAADKVKLNAVGTMANRAVTISTSAPSGGADGDFWAQVV